MSNDKKHSKGHGDHGNSHEAIEKWEKLRKHAQNIIDTTELHHREAYGAAVKEHLIGEDGQVDSERLEDEDLQKKFSETMADFYFEKAKDYFKVQGDLNELEKDTLLNAYSGFTKEGIRDLIYKNGKDFNYLTFFQNTNQLMQRLKGRLISAAASHLEDKHIEDIVKHVDAEDVVKTDALKKEESIQLLELYRDGAGKKQYAKALREAGAAYALKDKYRTKAKEHGAHHQEHRRVA